MKIKSVCELTALSDRTVRHYIEEGLLSPCYTENYLGRRAFDFSDADVQMLKDIAVLRKFGFSIAEIKTIQENPTQSIDIISAMRDRKQKIIDDEQALLSVINRLEDSRAYSVSELAEALSFSIDDAVLPAEDRQENIQRIVRLVIRTIFLGLLTFLPIIFVIMEILLSLHVYQYPRVTGRSLLALVATLLPAGCVVLMSKLKRKHPAKRSMRPFILLLCALYLPVSLGFSFLRY